MKVKDKELQEKKNDYFNQQMLRFGSNLVDLDSLEISGPSQSVLELTQKFEKTERECIREVEEKTAELDEEQRNLTEQVRRNTELLQFIIELGGKQAQQKKSLDEAKEDINQDDNAENKKKQFEEMEDIKSVLKTQAKEIETLKAEINLFKRKGGHIYSKVTSR